MLYFSKIAKRNYEPASLTSTTLSNFRNHDIQILIFVYSKNITSLGAFKIVRKSLIDPAQADRSGAAAHAKVQEVVDELKEIHKSNYSGSAISWNMWANSILASEPHLRAALMQEAPPGTLIELFTRAPDHRDNVLRNIRSNVSIGISMNQANVQHIRELRSSLNNIKEVAGRLTVAIQDADRRLELLEARSESNTDLMNAVEQAVQENEFSSDAYSRVVNIPDVDHN